MRSLKWALGVVLIAVFGLVTLYWTPDTDKASMRAKYGSRASQYIDLGGGLTVHLRDEGPRDAPVIVLLHGSNSSLQTWDSWTSALTGRFRIIRFDEPGHGLTGDYPARDYSRAAFADIVSRVTTRLGVARFILVGNSMGGGVAWAYAHNHPERLTGLVLVDAAGEPKPTNSSPPLGFRLARTPVVRDLMTYVTPRWLIADGLRQSVSNQHVVTPELIDRYWELLRYPGNRPATIDRFATPREESLLGPLPRPIPTLIMWGAEDKLIPVTSAAWFKGKVPDAEVVIYPKVGHLMMEEIPSRSVGDLAIWLEELVPTKTR